MTYNMKSGKWNYTEDIKYRVILVKIGPASKPLHWQNSLVGQLRQAVLIEKDNYRFWIDNGDGYGLLKVSRGGGPDSFSAHLEEGTFEIIHEDVPESEWNPPSPAIHKETHERHDDWCLVNHPEEYRSLLALRKAYSENKKNF